jgi:glycosyltransferase involved in cell wall biosynthesis
MLSLVVNAISVKEGGSLVVLRELVAGMHQLRPDWSIHIACSDEAKSVLAAVKGVDLHTFPTVATSNWRTRLWYETGLIRLLKDVSADALFSQTNYLPLFRRVCPQLLLEQHAGHFSAIFNELMCHDLNLVGRFAWRLKGNWVRESAVVADKITVQTAALADAMVSSTGVPAEKITVIPHGNGQSQFRSTNPVLPQQGEPFVVGYTTKFGVQKNFAVLFRAIAELLFRQVPIRLDITLDPTLTYNHKLLAYASQLDIGPALNNLGELNSSQLADAYSRFHAFAFPSLCESFGFPLVEAMANRLPVLVADVASNREVASAAGIYFDPNDHIALADEIQKLTLNAQWYENRVLASGIRQADYSWQRATEQTVRLIESMVHGSPK